MFREILEVILRRWVCRNEKKNDWELVVTPSVTKTIDCVKIPRNEIKEIMSSWPYMLRIYSHLTFERVITIQRGRLYPSPEDPWYDYPEEQDDAREDFDEDCVLVPRVRSDLARLRLVEERDRRQD